MPTLATRRAGARHGTAVVAALALVLLAAALLASAATVARAGADASQRARAGLAADAAARRVLAHAIASVETSGRPLDVGQAVVRDATPAADDATAALPLEARLRVHRLSADLYALTVDVRVGAAAQAARRRVSLLVQRRAVASLGGASSPPVPIAQWSMTDLY
jgi:hypothetical protein